MPVQVMLPSSMPTEESDHHSISSASSQRDDFGAIEAIAAVKSIGQGVIPPTLNLAKPDPEDRLEHVGRQPREASVRAVLCNAFGFGGVNSSLVLRRY